VIIDVDRFVQRSRTHWRELERFLDRLETAGSERLTVNEARRFHHLYERCAADLARISGFGAETEIRHYLSSLVGRAYAQIWETRSKQRKISLKTWFFASFPRTFRAHFGAFALAAALTLAGSGFGAVAILNDPAAKRVIMPFPELLRDPGDRVRREESSVNRELLAHRSTFSAQLMTHNTRVTLFTIALGITYGIGSALLLFYNGVILGALVMAHFSRDG
jgi:hypothetical protein